LKPVKQKIILVENSFAFDRLNEKVLCNFVAPVMRISMKLHIAFILSFIILSAPVFSQSGVHPEKCGTHIMHDELMQNPEYAAQFQEKMSMVKLQLKDKDLSKMECDDPLFIPVAVHYQDVGIDLACGIDMALDQIRILNEDFAGTNSDVNKFLDHAAATWPGIQNKQSCIVFCLATINHPDGSGIAEGDYAVTLNEYDDMTDNVPLWSGYLNLFVRDLAGLLGYSPLGGNGNGDGVVVDINAFSSISCGGNTLSGQYNLGRTATHEIGHYFTLSHPFDSPDCAVDGDGIADTPITNASTFGCYADGEVLVTCDDPILWPSYMDYCDDACLYMFSQGQVDQMDAYVEASLQNLLNNSAIVCEDAACLDFEASFNSTEESCAGADGRIAFNIQGATEPVSYSINNGITNQNDPVFSNLSAGEYDLIAIDAAGCEFVQSIELTRENAEMVVTRVENAFCGDNSGSINVSVNFEDEFEYSLGGTPPWQDTTFFGNLTSGTYTVVARSPSNCIGEIEVAVLEDSDLSPRVRQVKPVNCPLFDNGLIDVAIDGAEPPVFWRLNGGPPVEQGIFENLSQGQYNVFVQDSRGCQEELQFNIGISYANIGDDCPCQLFIPNAMSPDGNGLNDVFKVIPSCPISDYSIQIFNRWGEMIFESFDIEEVWNGGYEDYFASSNLYFYKIQFRWGPEDNNTIDAKTASGTITVLR
jgi:gliding motility-associated-like protein